MGTHPDPRISQELLANIQNVRKVLKAANIFTQLQFKKTILVLKTKGCSEQEKQHTLDLLAQIGITASVKDVNMATTRGSWTNTLFRMSWESITTAQLTKGLI